MFVERLHTRVCLMYRRSPYFFDIPESKKRTAMLITCRSTSTQSVPREFFQVSQMQRITVKTYQDTANPAGISESIRNTWAVKAFIIQSCRCKVSWEPVMSFIFMSLEVREPPRLEIIVTTIEACLCQSFSGESCHAWYFSVHSWLSISATSWARESSLQATNSSLRNREGVVYLSCSL